MTNYEKQIKKLKNRVNSYAESIDRLQDENVRLLGEKAILTAQVKNAEDALHISKSIMRQTLEEKNSKEQEFAEEIRLLRTKLKAQLKVVP